jgi:hypothetical protein
MAYPLMAERYGECNDHLRMADKKRDGILATYTTLTVALYTLAANNDLLILLGAAALTLLGLLVGAMFTLLRVWHGLYVVQALV